MSKNKERDWPLLLIIFFVFALGVWLLLDAAETYENAYELVVDNCRVGGRLTLETGVENNGLNWNTNRTSEQRLHGG